MADAAEPVITLFSECLLSKWGFNDGADNESWLDWCEANGIDYNAVDYPLVELVQTYLIPALDQRVTVRLIQTSHNPIRVDTVDGIDVTEQWYDGSAPTTRLTPEHVDVPMSEVLRLAGLPKQPESTESPASRKW
ncbi:hypothetical protein [Streptomyces sp. NBC_01262]|uniref:hypothetical protein n=1 Tax=Streptomyces sp. NBC_01262 TaxID=2903803 RepID=UPI002E3537F7|nr:hypothetical protein [Streptomyces sp. NBC_01262]